ncbi:Oidioi.mRNA.OKI2018_I69.chr2.g8119.t1.cds [Oikopleura dioica]|uniref:Meiotic nuclear division protein 1 homolog n=1 Tax=Oikopleura dioica TaxID=34765 RepID=A0ABN7TES9_OIKDI|nr:Oidioi.mRNA.OKI2018_I69.chr2.g8119.t1.cds [Oikopleura dioica]
MAPGSKRGMSMEEKCDAALDWIRKQNSFFHMKDLEKSLPKAKGITPMSIKDVIQTLVDDDRLMTEKVGSSSFYWCFDSQLVNSLDSSTTKLKAELEQLNAETKTKGEKLRFYQENDEDISPEELQKLKNELKALTNEEASLTKECEASKKFTPEYLQKLDQDKKLCIEGVNRWTDNIWNVTSFVKKRDPTKAKMMAKHFGVPEDMDYVEE